ncbi:MAG: glycosyltransferase [Lachnospiraceae bacterium]|nr:glycosyltransferase [Lachnospiraceae bacterium]
MQNLVSIIMPSYNTAEYIASSIESVQAQTYPNWELIIMDDCSTDHTEEVLQKYLSDKRIHYFRNKRNSGAAVSRNRALRKAQGRWIAFLDSDDLWHPEKLERQIAFMVKKPCSFSYTKYEEIDEKGNALGIVVSGPKRITKKGMYRYCWPGCLTVMYDQNEIGKIQIADIKKNNDYAMWLKVCKKADCCLYPAVMAKYRKRSGSISNHSYGRLIKWHYKLFREAEERNILPAVWSTCRNMIFGAVKKIRFHKKIKE